MKLIKDWKSAWKFLSVQLMALGTGISTTYATMYGQLKDTIDPQTMAYVTGSVFAAGIIGRLLSQGMEDK